MRWEHVMKSVVATTLSLSLFTCCGAYADVINNFPVGTVATTQVTGADITIGTFSETARASNPAAPGSFNPINFSPVAGGGIGGPVSFTSPIGGTLLMTVNDLFLVGDVYQAFLDGTSLGFTSFVPIGGPTLSSGSFTASISPGSHTFNITDITLNFIGSPSPFGGGIVPSNFDPAGLTVSLSAVPGPIAGAGLPGLILAAGGLLALARRRQKIA
jgi:hypothetical protein